MEGQTSILSQTEPRTQQQNNQSNLESKDRRACGFPSERGLHLPQPGLLPKSYAPPAARTVQILLRLVL